MITTSYEKFRLLLWKNWLLQLNHKWRTIFQICTPMLITFILVGVRQLIKSESVSEVRYKKSFELTDLNLLRKQASSFIDYRLSYSPAKCTFCEKIMKEVAKKANVKLYPCESSTDLENKTNELNLLAGIDFGDNNYGVRSYPKKLQVYIRFPSELRTTGNVIQIWHTNELFLPLDPYGPRNRFDDHGGAPSGYLVEGFLTIQNLISLAYIKQASSESYKVPLIKMQRFPYPAYIDDPLQKIFTGVLSVIILLAYLQPSTYIVRQLALEREKPLKEVLKIMGLSNWQHWLAWFVKTFSTMVVSSILVTMVLTVKWTSDGIAVIMKSSFSTIFVFLVVYSTVTITFCFMITMFSKSVIKALAVAGFWWFISFIPYIYISMDYDDTSTRKKLMWCSLSNTCMGFGMRQIVEWEMNGEGLHWNNIAEQSSITDPLRMIDIIYMMLVMTVVQVIICLYVEQVIPGSLGTPQPWYFPFQTIRSSYLKKTPQLNEVFSEDKELDPKYFEKEPDNAEAGIVISHLTKYYGKTLAVKNLSFNMYRNEITVLLGHNGAGKSTIISILSGMRPPTSGTAYIMGHDIRTEKLAAREYLSICPQKNVIFNDLRVEQNFQFFAYLRGLRDEDLDDEVDSYLQMSNLKMKATVLSGDLSICKKRKLSVCCALCGGPEVVFLDSPTLGMDPTARKLSWNIMQQAKQGRTILLITHFMNEADVLADRVAIMSAGELICHGTPFFLKKQFGCGYKLICVKGKDCITGAVTNFLKGYIHNLEVADETDVEILYILEGQYAPQFSKILGQFEYKMKDLKILEFGLSTSTIDEVFMKTGAEQYVLDIKSAEFDLAISSFSKRKRLAGIKLKWSQFRSMILKKYLHTSRNRVLIVMKLFLIIIFVFLSIVTTFTNYYPKQAPISLSLERYDNLRFVVDTSVPSSAALAHKILANVMEIVTRTDPTYTVILTEEFPFEDYLLKTAVHRNIIDMSYIAGATVTAKQFLIWFNNKPLHSAPIALNLFHNGLARTVIGPEAKITIINYPLPYRKSTKLTVADTGLGLGIELTYNVVLCMSILCPLFALFIIRERDTRAKLLQFISGINIIIFWMGHFLWDLIYFILLSTILIITLALYDQESYRTKDELGRNYVLLLCFPFSALPFTYLMSRRYNDPINGFAKLSMFNIFFGIGLFTVALILGLGEMHLRDAGYSLETFLLMYPHFALAKGLHTLYINHQLHAICKPLLSEDDSVRCANYTKCCKMIPYYAWERPGIGRPLIYLLFSGIAYCILIIFIQYRLTWLLWDRYISRLFFIKHVLSKARVYDSDVEEERKRIDTMTRKDTLEYNLVMKRLTKFYGNFLAVNQISAAIKEAECFGLLGLDGAGKTTTFRMLTMEVWATYGMAFFKGMSVAQQTAEVFKEIGYCPQAHAFFDEFTGGETIRFFGMIHGIPYRRLTIVSQNIAKVFGFMKRYNNRVDNYSISKKRMLNCGIAVIGDPSVVLLDEPTYGMDIASRRRLWTVINRIRLTGKTIVLTSTSMDECEALCTRMAIMVKGEFRCLGAIQHLRIKYSQGLTLSIKVKSVPTPKFSRPSVGLSLRSPRDMREMAIETWVKKQFPDAILADKFQGLLSFKITNTKDLTWSRLFGEMESQKDALFIDDYSVHQTNLEDIFLHFTKR